MKNLENFGVQALNITELNETFGGDKNTITIIEDNDLIDIDNVIIGIDLL